ncbi:DUF2059 domain-containing protein [Phenylobacterium sp. VNQ135]|uniref:DUF2059 domain-containing protein n=1 Tax=Phenylobacterium sp. VNQ135 TaxID=3400922 RepID=UPI003BFD3D8E
MALRLFAAAAAGLAVLITPLQAGAQPSARSLELARRYVAALNMEEMLATFVTGMATQMFERQTKTRDIPLTNEVRIAFADAVDESTRAITPKMMEAMLPAVAEHFTEAELEAAVAYLETPLGRAFMRKSPQLMGKVERAVNPLTPEFSADLQARFCKKIGCEDPPAR